MIVEKRQAVAQALEQQDPSLCVQMITTGPQNQGDCLLEIIKQMEQPPIGLCNMINIRQIGLVDECKAHMALLYSSVSLCDEIYLDIQQWQCFRDVLKTVKDSSICETIKNKNRDICLFEYKRLTGEE